VKKPTGTITMTRKNILTYTVIYYRRQHCKGIAICDAIAVLLHQKVCLKNNNVIFEQCKVALLFGEMSKIIIA